MKYPVRNNHELSADFIHFDANEKIKRGIAKMTKIIGAISRCLY